MCKKLMSDYIVGNILIEAIDRQKYCVRIEDVFKIDDELSKLLIVEDTYSDVDVNDICLFAENYPYFSHIEDDHICIKDNNNKLKIRLLKYFRVGLPLNIVEQISSASNIVFA